MKTREFFDIACAAEGRIGSAVELDFHDLNGFDTLALHEAKRLGCLPPITLAVDVKPGGFTGFDAVVNPLGWQIVSKRVAEAFVLGAGNDVELLPVEIKNLEGETLRSDFFVINATRMVDALSETRSVRSKNKLGSVYPVMKVAIEESRVPDDIHLFRLKESPHALFADNVVKKAVLQVPHDGVVFIPV